MTSASKDKGTRAETAAKELLKKHTQLNWQRVPGSGSLSANHRLKGDLYIPDCSNIYAVEVKHYKEDHLTSKLLTDKTPVIFEWWSQAIRQAAQVEKDPLLIFKYDRSKFFVAFESEPTAEYRHIYYSACNFYVAKLEDWLLLEKPMFVRK